MSTGIAAGGLVMQTTYTCTSFFNILVFLLVPLPYCYCVTACREVHQRSSIGVVDTPQLPPPSGLMPFNCVPPVPLT